MNISLSPSRLDHSEQSEDEEYQEECGNRNNKHKEKMYHFTTLQ